MSTRYIAGLKKTPWQAMANPPKTIKISRQKLKGAEIKEENQYYFLLRIVDDVLVAIRKYIPSLDYMQGGPPLQDLTNHRKFKSTDDFEREAFKRPGYQQRLIDIRKNGYEVGTKNVKGVEHPVVRRPTQKEMNDAVRFAIHELQYIRAEVIREEGDGVGSSPKKQREPVTVRLNNPYLKAPKHVKKARPLTTKHQKWRERLLEQMFTNKFNKTIAAKEAAKKR